MSDPPAHFSESDKLLWIASGLEEEGKLGEAISVYAQAVLLGNVDAMNNLATLYDDKLVPPKHDAAVALYKRAAGLGSAMAAWNLAMHYRMRDDKARYHEWLQSAADLGDEHAAAVLAGTAQWYDDTY